MCVIVRVCGVEARVFDFLFETGGERNEVGLSRQQSKDKCCRVTVILFSVVSVTMYPKVF